jgi:hypothetical protein
MTHSPNRTSKYYYGSTGDSRSPRNSQSLWHQRNCILSRVRRLLGTNRDRSLGDSLSRVWYNLIRHEVRPDGAAVERSCRLPLSHEEVALVVLSLADGETFTPVQIQKALFLADDKAPRAFRTDSRYRFEPYDYGPFDWQVYADVENLERRGLARVNQQPGSRWRTYAASPAGIAEGRRLATRVGIAEQITLQKIVHLVRSLSFNELVSAIYKAYPPMRARSVFRD